MMEDTEMSGAVSAGGRPGETPAAATELQRSLHDLLAKRGVIQDLRAHLRSHLIALVRHANSGEPLICKDLLKQRLEAKFQVVNMLIAEYLMRQEFNYSLSVFSSEIPLERMSLDYARALLDKTAEERDLRFQEADILHIVSTLGICASAEQATRIVNVYASSPQRPALLVCLLQALSHEAVAGHVGTDEIQSEVKPDLTASNSNKNDCTHLESCETCISRKLVKSASKDKCVGQMFDQLQSVYEREASRSRGHDERFQRQLAAYRQLLHVREKALEEEYQRRNVVQESKIEDRKRFLWQLARRLRQQHEELARGLHKVHVERDIVEKKERTLQDQFKSAEEVLQRTAEEMRAQLNEELKIFEQHVEAMKIERENIAKEREALEKLKTRIPNQSDEVKTEFEDQKKIHVELDKNYDILSIVQKYIEAAKAVKPKSLVESSSMTDIYGVNSQFNCAMNNECDNCPGSEILNRSSVVSVADSKESSVVGNNWCVTRSQLFNDLKKLKNVNYMNNAIVQANQSELPDCILPSSNAPPPGTPAVLREALTELRQDNSSLRALARQQEAHIAQLDREQSRLRSELASARRDIDHVTRLYDTRRRRGDGSWSPRASGAGEAGEAPATPRGLKLLRPERHDGRRSHGLTTWRRHSPPRRTAPRPPRARCAMATPESPELRQPTQNKEAVDNAPKKTMNKQTDYIQLPGAHETRAGSEPDTDGDSSPTQEVLTAAKTRLRKLEIEAEVVERSYQDFRRRKADDRAAPDMRPDSVDHNKADSSVFNTDKRPVRHVENIRNEDRTTRNTCPVYNKYPSDYRVNKVPITNVFQNQFIHLNRFTDVTDRSRDNKYKIKEKRQNLIEKPLMEFRKLYQSNVTKAPTSSINNALQSLRHKEGTDTIRTITDSKGELINLKRNFASPNIHNTQLKLGSTTKRLTDNELEKLRNNIQKVYNMDESLKQQRSEQLQKLKFYANNELNENMMQTQESFNRTIVRTNEEEPEFRSGRILDRKEFHNSEGTIILPSNTTNESYEKLSNMDAVETENKEHYKDVVEQLKADVLIISQLYDKLQDPECESERNVCRSVIQNMPATKIEKIISSEFNDIKEDQISKNKDKTANETEKANDITFESTDKTNNLLLTQEITNRLEDTKEPKTSHELEQSVPASSQDKVNISDDPSVVHIPMAQDENINENYIRSEKTLEGESDNSDNSKISDVGKSETESLSVMKTEDSFWE